jgi:hypothetical protein
MRVVPDVFRLLAQVLRYGIKRIVIAIAARKDNNAEFHGDDSHFSSDARVRPLTPDKSGRVCKRRRIRVQSGHEPADRKAGAKWPKIATGTTNSWTQKPLFL